jgi:hypothetical protein
MQPTKNLTIQCSSAPPISVFYGSLTFIVIGIMGIRFLFLGNFTSVTAGVVLLLFSLFLFSKQIRNVTFTEKGIAVKYNLFFKTKNIDYKQCKKLYKTNDGDSISPVNVIYYQINHNTLKKITFYCEDDISPIYAQVSYCKAKLSATFGNAQNFLHPKLGMQFRA